MGRNLIRFTCLLVLLALCLFGAQVTAAQTPSAKRLAAKVDEYMNAAFKFEKFSGAILIARDGVPIVTRS